MTATTHDELAGPDFGSRPAAVDSATDLESAESARESAESVNDAAAPVNDGEADTATDEELAGWEDLLPGRDRDEIAALLREPYGPFKLADGTEVKVTPLKLREFLAMLRIISVGSGAQLANMSLNTNDRNLFMQNLFAALLFAIPEADEEVVQFVQMITVPAYLPPKAEDEQRARDQLRVKLYNPDLEDVVDILAVVVRSEAEDLVALGKRLRVMFGTAQKMGIVKS